MHSWIHKAPLQSLTNDHPPEKKFPRTSVTLYYLCIWVIHNELMKNKEFPNHPFLRFGQKRDRDGQKYNQNGEISNLARISSSWQESCSSKKKKRFLQSVFWVRDFLPRGLICAFDINGKKKSCVTQILKEVSWEIFFSWGWLKTIVAHDRWRRWR